LVESIKDKDNGARMVNDAEKLKGELAQEFLKICDDIFRAESLSNHTDPELKRIALVGIKRVISGANNDITNNFAYTSPNLIA
jgi:hypothetical protein